MGVQTKVIYNSNPSLFYSEGQFKKHHINLKVLKPQLSIIDHTHLGVEFTHKAIPSYTEPVITKLSAQLVWWFNDLSINERLWKIWASITTSWHFAFHIQPKLLVILASPSGCQLKTAGTDSGVRKVKHNLLTLLFLSVGILQQTACGAGIYSCSFSLFSFLSPLISRLLPAFWN